jgi:sulfate transport system substrate-binding protein
MRHMLDRRTLVAGTAALAGVVGARPVRAAEPTTILNVSYDIGRELFADINKAFVAAHAKATGSTVTVNQSHAGSSRQARAILEGLEADVVTFNQVSDVQILVDRGRLVAADWRQRLPNGSSPYHSLPLMIVRKGNPKGIKDWGDLERPDVAVVMVNPKTGGNGRYAYLAAWTWAAATRGGEPAARAFLRAVLGNVAVFDSGGRAATTSFVERGIGDVLLTFEAETVAIRREYGADRIEPVIPSQSVLAEFPVAVVDKVVDRRGSRALAEAYLRFLWTPEAQEIIARAGNRPSDAATAARFADSYPPVRLVRVEEALGGWPEVMERHFRSDGVMDELLPRR